MDNKNILEDEIEILDDIEEETILFNELPTTNDRTYVEDNSLQDSGEVLVGMALGVDEHTVDDALTKFNTDVIPVQPIKQEIVKEPEIVIEDVTPVSEVPSLSDELDNTLMLAKQAIHPEVVTKTVPAKDDAKSNKRIIIFVIVIFVLLGIFALVFPFIDEIMNLIK